MGHKEIRRRCIELGVDTLVVFDTHWLVNSGFHINNAGHFAGVYTSNELPHFIKNMPYEYQGNTELGNLIAHSGHRCRGVYPALTAIPAWLWSMAL